MRCDQSTMTPAEITAGHLICVVGLASVKPAVFHPYRIKIQLKTPWTSPGMSNAGVEAPECIAGRMALFCDR